MKVVSIGGGPAGLYFSILMKKHDPSAEIVVYERNAADDTFGFGVVFSDATLNHFAEADGPSHAEILRNFAHWDDIDIHYRGNVITSTGHGFSGMSRQCLLGILQRRALELGVRVEFQKEIPSLDHTQLSLEAGRDLADADLILAADGVNSLIRAQLAPHFEPSLDWRSNRFIWLGTTLPLTAFTFLFKEDAAGLWRVHAYRYNSELSTFIVECTSDTWRRAGMDTATEDQSIAYLEQLFEEELQGHRLLKNRSIWRAFPTIRCRSWVHRNIVLMGDAAHTAHFSIGSGTKLAMEDAIELAKAVREAPDVSGALQRYDHDRRAGVEAVQRAAQVSLEWFEDTERYYGRLEPIQFAFSLLTRSLRITHDNLSQRDLKLVKRVDRWVAETAQTQSGVQLPVESTPPLFTPFKLRDLILENRVVMSPMCQYSAEDGMPNDWHLVHLGSRAIGGAGLIMTEMTDISADGRITPGCTGLYRDEHIPAWKRIVDFVHSQSRARIGVQLAHAGRKGSTRKLWEGMDLPLEKGGWPLMAASALPYKEGSDTPRAMTRADMLQVVADFVAATERAEQAGFDLLEVHMAHGYLLSTFLSPLTNIRTDEFGGSLENRLRFPLEVFDAVRSVWPAHKPISVRISAHDWHDGGNVATDAVEIARALKAHGADIIDVSSGQVVSDEKPVYGRLFQTPFSDRIRHEVGIPTITVGNISSYTDVNSIIAAGRADLCALARAHLYDPYWTRHAAQELGYRLPWPPQYVSLARYSPRFR